MCHCTEHLDSNLSSLGREIDRYIDSIIFSNEFDVFQSWRESRFPKPHCVDESRGGGENCVANRSVDAKVGSLNPIWFRHVQKSNLLCFRHVWAKNLSTYLLDLERNIFIPRKVSLLLCGRSDRKTEKNAHIDDWYLFCDSFV